jgi:SPP1 family predicted phage head-tail adaptor
MLRQSVLNPSIRAGELTRQVSFAHVSVAQDGSGQPINTWSNYLTTRAKMENLSGQQLYQSDSFTAQGIWRITLHYHAGIVSGDRCFYAPSTGTPHTFDVQLVNDILERHRVLQLTCLEIDGSS